MTGNGRRDRMDKPLLGAVLCCTAVLPEQRTRFAEIIVQMGGEHKLDLTSDVTHLLVEVSDAPTVLHLTAKYKYVAANREDVRVLQPAWLEAVRQSWMTGESFNMQALEDQYKLPLFAGLSVCLTGFEDLTFRKQLQDRIVARGGDYRGDLTKNVTHLIANAPEGKKYQYAEQWHVQVVSLRWFKDCLDRSMVLEESLYHPTMPFEEQGKGAWNREAKVQIQLGKRPRAEDPPLEAPRKLRRTASSKLGSQSENLWGDIMGGGFDTRPSPELPLRLSKPHPGAKPVVLEPESFVAENAGVDDDRRTLQNNIHRPQTPLSGVYQGYFSDQAFLVHGFPQKNDLVLRNVLKDNGAFLVDSLVDMNTLPGMVRGLFVIIPYHMPRTDIPSIDAVHPTPKVVTDMWIERCLAYKVYLDPDKHPTSTPVRRFPIGGFDDLTINSTGFEGIDLLHLSKIVRLVGATYDETLQPKIAVLVCNKTKANPEKQHYARSWGVPVVTDTWFWECCASGRLHPFDFSMMPALQQGERDTMEVARENGHQGQVRGKPRATEDSGVHRRTDKVSVKQDAASPMPANGAVTSKGQKSLEQTQSRPGTDLHEDGAPTLGRREDRSRKIRPDRQSAKENERSSAVQPSPELELEEAMPLQEICTNSPPRPPLSSPTKKKKPLFRPFDGNGSAPSTAMSDDPAPIGPVPTSTGKTEYVPPQTDSINDAIHDLLHMTSKARGSAPSAAEGATKKTRLLSRALSNMSNSSRQSRASSVDSMNTDGVGSVIGADQSQSGKPRSVARSGSFTGRATGKAKTKSTLPIDSNDPGLSRDEFADEEPTPPMTQLGYGEHEDAVKIREKLAEKRRNRCRQGQETVAAVAVERRIKDDEAILGGGWGGGRRTRHKERSPKGMEAF